MTPLSKVKKIIKTPNRWLNKHFFKMLFIRKLKPELNVQTDSKVFV